MKILQILAHPDYDNKNRISNLLAELGEEELRKKYNNITTLNLYDPKCYIPVMDKHMFNYDDKELTKQEEADKIRQEELLNIWKNSDYVFIYMPLHNFNVVSKFKDFIDNIVIVNNIDYTDKLIYTIYVMQEDYSNFETWIANLTNGQFKIISSREKQLEFDIQ